MLRTATLIAILCSGLHGQINLSVTQPQGAGSLHLVVSGAQPRAELYNLISNAPHSPTGRGPFLGLSLTNSHHLLDQLLSPIGTAPYHVHADAAGSYVWDLSWAPLGMTADFDLVTLEWSATRGILQSSPVVYVSVSI